jgi:uncharacterized membrane protein
MGALTGTAIGLSGGQLIVGVFAGIIGSVVGTFAAAKGRALAAKLFGRDLPAALLEDAIGIVLALVVALAKPRFSIASSM